MILRTLRNALSLFTLLTILTGFLYPLTVMGIARLFFPFQANGSLIEHNGKIIGSELIGQNFSEAKYFWGRPSATSHFPYNAMDSGASNFSQSNLKLLQRTKDTEKTFQMYEGDNPGPIPVDLLSSSGSGLDPHISPLAAFYQVARIAKARQISETEIHSLVDSVIEDRTFKILGEARVNVLKLNMALDTYVPRFKVQ